MTGYSDNLRYPRERDVMQLGVCIDQPQVILYWTPAIPLN